MLKIVTHGACLFHLAIEKDMKCKMDKGGCGGEQRWANSDPVRGGT